MSRGLPTTAPRTPHTHEFSFPPFPPVPKGVTLIPFKDFKGYGIQPFLGDDEIERDGLGIPTIALSTKHDTDLSKTDPSRSTMGRGMEKTGRNEFWRKEWWEDWEEGEDLRIYGPYDPNVARVDRFHQAASDFQKYRKFPPASTNVQYLWDQFRIFAGLLGTTPVWQKTSEKPDSDGGLEKISGDDEDDLDRVSSVHNNNHNNVDRSKRLRPRAPYDLYGKSPNLVENNDEIQELLSQARAAKDDKVVKFLNDPARGVRVFLSSYMIYQGLIYTDKITNAPHLLRFFLNYLLRARVFPDDRKMEWGLRWGLGGDFGRGCGGVWGARGDCTCGGEVDGDLIGGGGEGVDVDVGDGDGEVVLASDLDDADGNVDPCSIPSPTNDENDCQLFVVSASDPSSNHPSSSSWELEAEADDLPDAADDWAAPTRPSLLALFGGLPVTHTPGVVEWSVRRVKSVSMPTPPPAPPKFNRNAACANTRSGEQGEVGTGPDAEAVEREIEGMFARVVMEPWIGWDGGENSDRTQPARILRSSLGEIVNSSSSATPPVGPSALKPHDLLKDDITLLLEPGVARDLCDGMGIGGTWVQIARVGDVPVVEADGVAGIGIGVSTSSLVKGNENGEKDGGETSEKEPKSKSKKKKKKKEVPGKAQKERERRGLRYWYLEDEMMVLPSYWLV
ncbi:hypothetical protein R3P38DRAFT_3590234 [Favolaschia claudopus]|uniref:Uncharacterized protein n=1 Tax=Favolaschia claudopus TaxID=2862362 RepID=A0AAW0AH19_9AGAR